MKGRNEIFKYKYAAEIVEKEITVNGEKQKFFTVKDRDKFQNCPIEFNFKTGQAFVYSDKELPGFSKVGDNKKPNDNVMKAAAVS